MLNIGIVGAENSHCGAIAKVCNVDKQVRGARVTHVWGETKAFAQAAAEKGQIPNIVDDWKEMLGQVDGIMIDHRHPGPHAEVAKFFLSNGVPCFVDKPFTYRLRDAKALIRLAREKNVPLTSFSVIPLQENFQAFKKEVQKLGAVGNLNTTGPADIRSKHGGVFFYGIHQVDAIIELLGTDVKSVQVIPHGKGGVAIMTYRNGPIVTLNLMQNGLHKFHWSAVCEKGILNWDHVGDSSPYLGGAKTFVKMFRTGKEPFSAERLLAPVAVLEAMEKSIERKGAEVRVAKLDV